MQIESLIDWNVALDNDTQGVRKEYEKGKYALRRIYDSDMWGNALASVSITRMARLRKTFKKARM